MHTPLARSSVPLSAILHALRPLRRLLTGRSRPRLSLLLSGALALTFSGTLPTASASAYFNGQETREQGSRADWSEDLGGDYVLGWVVGADNNHLELVGHGTGSSSGPVSKWYDSGFSLDWELTARGGPVGHTYSGGSAEVPEAGDVEGRIFKYHLYSELDRGASWFTQTDISASHFFTNDLPTAPLYYAIRYALTVVTETQLYVNANISNSPPPGQFTVAPFQGLLSAGTHHFEGVTTGVINFGNYSVLQNPFETRALFGTQLQLVNSPAGAGQAEMLVELVYSATPLTEFPEIPSTSVPETLPLLSVMAAALAGLALVRRRVAA